MEGQGLWSEFSSHSFRMTLHHTISVVCRAIGILICLLDGAVGVVGCVRANVIGAQLVLGGSSDPKVTTSNRNAEFAVFFAGIVLMYAPNLYLDFIQRDGFGSNLNLSVP